MNLDEQLEAVARGRSQRQQFVAEARAAHEAALADEQAAARRAQKRRGLRLDGSLDPAAGTELVDGVRRWLKRPDDAVDPRDRCNLPRAAADAAYAEANATALQVAQTKENDELRLAGEKVKAAAGYLRKMQDWLQGDDATIVRLQLEKKEQDERQQAYKQRQQELHPAMR